MPTISGSLNLVTNRPVDSISEVWVRARETRGQGDGLVVGVNDRVPVSGGVVEFTALPGAAVLVLVQNGMPIETLPMLIADDAQQSLRAAVQAVQIADSAERRELEQLAVEVLNNVALAAQYRTEAASSANKARQSESAAESAAGAAAAATADALREEMKPVTRANAAYMGQSLAASHMAADSANTAKAILERIENIASELTGKLDGTT